MPDQAVPLEVSLGSNFTVSDAFEGRPELAVKLTKPIESGPLACDFPLLGALLPLSEPAPYGEK